VVSYDGVGAELAWDWIYGGAANDRDGLAAMTEHGLAAERLRMVDPTLTAVNHATLVTGRTPAQTGIVSNGFRHPGTPITQTVSGFAVSSGSEALWMAARRHGIRVGTLMWPGTDAGALDRIGDFGVLWPGSPLGESVILDLVPEAAEPFGSLPSEDGVEVLKWGLEVELGGAVPDSVALEVAVLDGTPDGRPRYDTVAGRRADEEEWETVAEREWFGIEFEARSRTDLRPRRYAVSSKGLYLDRFRGSLRLYLGAAWRLRAYPDAFEDLLTEAVGPWPGLPDDRLLAEWWLDYAEGIDLDAYVEQIERLDRYLDEIARWVIEGEEFGLLLAYHPTADEYQHSSLISHPDQWGYSPGKAVAAREGLHRVGRSVDRSVGTLWRALKGGRAVLLVVSDHGHLPIHDVVHLGKVLADAGLMIPAANGRVAESSPMAVSAHGACAHLYLNLIGREPTGVVDPSQAEEELRRAARALADLTQAGEPVVERVLTREGAAAIGLDHPSSGDLIAFLKPGFAFSARLGEAVIEPSRYYGQHGYLAHHDGMCGMLFARGVGIKPAQRREMRATEVAPLVAGWLGFQFAR
jgi:predicted AlkP superfamily phosphohydrolase/phosphomutase